VIKEEEENLETFKSVKFSDLKKTKNLKFGFFRFLKVFFKNLKNLRFYNPS